MSLSSWHSGLNTTTGHNACWADGSRRFGFGREFFTGNSDIDMCVCVI